MLFGIQQTFINSKKLYECLLMENKMTIRAYILGKMAPTKEQDIKAELLQFPNVKTVDICFGNYDFIAICEAENMETLESGGIERIRAVENILSTETMIVSVSEKTKED